MKIKSPLCITSRLLPGVKIGEATISIKYSHVTSDGRQAYRWSIDFAPKWVESLKMASVQEFQGDKLCSGVGGGSLQEGLESLLCFLGTFAEALDYQEGFGQSPENSNLFPAALGEWAKENSDEFASLEAELIEHPGEYIQE